jgi:hypothetical protein
MPTKKIHQECKMLRVVDFLVDVVLARDCPAPFGQFLFCHCFGLGM